MWHGMTVYAVFTLLLLLMPAVTAQSLVFPPYLHSYGIRKATPKHLFMFFGPRTFFSNPQGLATARLETWDDPSKKGDDDEVVVYGINAGRGEIIYNTSMWSLGLFGEKGSGKGQLLEPRGIAANGKGAVYVADSGNNRVVRLFNPKSSLKWVSTFNAGQTGTKLKGPSRIGVDERVNVYVTDPGNSRLVIFDSEGNVRMTIPGPGNTFSFKPGLTALAIADGSSHWSYRKHEQAIFCADNNGSRVLKLGFDGKLLAQTKMPDGHLASYGAIDYYHNYYVTDPVNHCVVKFDCNLKLLDIFGSHGDKDNQFNEPRGIAIYKRFGQTFIAEKKGAQYFWIGTECKKVSLKPLGKGNYSMPITVTEYGYISLFSALKGDTITYFKRNRISCGASVFTFSVAGEGRVRDAGLTLKLEPTYSSFTFNAWYYPVKPVTP